MLTAALVLDRGPTLDGGPAGGQGRPLSDDADQTPAPGSAPGPGGLAAAAERLSRIAALALGFDHGTVLLPDERTVPRQADRPSAAADLDRQVLASGKALVLERVDGGLTPLGAYAGVPVSCEDQVVSVLSVCDELGRTISRRDVAVLLELAELWSIELCRAQDAVDRRRPRGRSTSPAGWSAARSCPGTSRSSTWSAARWWGSRPSPAGAARPGSSSRPASSSRWPSSPTSSSTSTSPCCGGRSSTWPAGRPPAPSFWVTTNVSARHLGAEGWLDRLQDASTTRRGRPDDGHPRAHRDGRADRRGCRPRRRGRDARARVPRLVRRLRLGLVRAVRPQPLHRRRHQDRPLVRRPARHQDRRGRHRAPSSPPPPSSASA